VNNDEKILQSIAKGMHDEVMGIIHRYANQVENSDLSINDFQAEISLLAASIIAGVVETMPDDRRREMFTASIVIAANKIRDRGKIDKISVARDSKK